ncbi:MAG TPA: hypothetical protein VGL62_15405, partial [Vicinamibacterales bacterium]
MLLGLITQPALPSASPHKLSAVALLDLYDRGDYARAIDEINQTTGTDDLDSVDAGVSAQAAHWIGTAEPPRRLRRAFVAGAVALEITHAIAARESWLTEHRTSHVRDAVGLPEVTRLIVREVGLAPTNVEYDWILACVATWLDWDSAARTPSDWQMTPEPGWAVLLGQPQLIEHFAK